MSVGDVERWQRLEGAGERSDRDFVRDHPHLMAHGVVGGGLVAEETVPWFASRTDTEMRAADLDRPAHQGSRVVGRHPLGSAGDRRLRPDLHRPTPRRQPRPLMQRHGKQRRRHRRGLRVELGGRAGPGLDRRHRPRGFRPQGLQERDRSRPARVRAPRTRRPRGPPSSGPPARAGPAPTARRAPGTTAGRRSAPPRQARVCPSRRRRSAGSLQNRTWFICLPSRLHELSPSPKEIFPYFSTSCNIRRINNSAPVELDKETA